MGRQILALIRTRRTRFARMGLLMVGLGVFLAGCGGTASTPSSGKVAPAPTQVRVATATVVEPTRTPAPTATSRPVPSATATPVLSPTAAPTESPSPTNAVEPVVSSPSYAADVQTIFTDRCIKCHSGQSPPRGLWLDSYDQVMAGGTYRPVVLPGNPDESEIVRRIKGSAIPRMPLDGPPFLSDDQIATIEAWIEAGAPYN